MENTKKLPRVAMSAWVWAMMEPLETATRLPI